jgi:hypothetical protein
LIDIENNVNIDFSNFNSLDKRFEEYNNINFDLENTRKEIILKNKIDAIYDNGHPQLRAVCFALGGYVANGYISEMEAMDYAEDMIRHNAYLGIAKKVNTYIRTSVTMIRKGQTQPLSL